MNQNHIRLVGALHHLVPQKRAEEIIKHVEGRNGYYAQGKRLDDIDWRTADKDELGQEIYNEFCRDKGIVQVYRPENVRTVLDLIARKYGYIDADAMLAHDYGMHERLWGHLATYAWYGDYITRQEIDTPFIANTYWKTKIEPTLTDADRQAMQERKRACPPVVRRKYGDVELAHLIMAYLKKNRMRDFTYNAVAQTLNADWKQASRILHGMARRDHRVIGITCRDTNGKAVKLFKFAPERKLIDMDVTRTETVVSCAILRLVADTPGLSVRAVKDTARNFFGHLSDKAVDDSLAALIRAGAIVCRQGPRRAKLHFIPDKSTADKIYS